MDLWHSHFEDSTVTKRLEKVEAEIVKAGSHSDSVPWRPLEESVEEFRTLSHIVRRVQKAHLQGSFDDLTSLFYNASVAERLCLTFEKVAYTSRTPSSGQELAYLSLGTGCAGHAEGVQQMKQFEISCLEDVLKDRYLPVERDTGYIDI